MRSGIAACIVLLMLAVAAGAASADSPSLEAVSLDTSIAISPNGDGHVIQHIVIKDLSTSPIAVGVVSIRLPGNGTFPGNLLGSPHGYTNITVRKQDGSPVEYYLIPGDDSLILDIFCREKLMEGWNTHFILTYDIGSIANGGILTSQVAYANGMEGMSINDSRVTLNIPPGTRATYTSPGATIDGERIIWRGKDALSIFAEYTSLPIPGLPIPFQYAFWGGSVLISLIWCFKSGKW
jgi:hypothetical protein